MDPIEATAAEMELDPREARLKELHLAQPERCLDRPCSSDAVRDVIKEAFSPHVPNGRLLTTIPEEHFFRAHNDVAVVKHLRYLPAVEHLHAFFELGCLMSGNCTNFIDGQGLEMQPGDVCIVSPGTVHAVSAFSDDTILLNVLIRSSTIETAFSNVVLESDPLSGFFLRPTYGLPTKPFLYLKSSGDPDVDTYIRMVHDESTKERPYQGTLLNSLVTALLVALFRNYRDDSQNADQVSAILRHVRENLTDVTLTSLSAHLAYSERHVQRILSGDLHTTFSDLLQRVRMERAADLVRAGQLPISEVATAVGYANPGNFRRTFKRYHGATPADYRQAAASRTATPSTS